ncbi:ABC transporter ATP-binding protein, partial [bacterium]|nr:ABC transporter ATP-binding protein [bacterium]
SDLTVKYNYGAEAIARLSLICDKGGIATIFAPAEGGKTSLIKAIGGLVKVASGKIIVNGQNITYKSCKDRNVSILYNELGIFKNKTIEKNLLYPLIIRKTDIKKAKAVIKIMADRFNLSNDLQKKAKKADILTKIAVVFARAFLREADVYLIDNIFSNVEIRQRKEVFLHYLPYIQELSQKAPLIFATDSNFEAEALGQKVVVLNYGITLQKGEYKDIKNNPLSITVCKLFYGEKLDLCEATLKKENDILFVEGFNEKIFLSKDKLINEIFVNKTVVLARVKGDNNFGTKIFDIKSEQLIYFR